MKRIAFLLLAFCAAVGFVRSAEAKGLTLIRDAEIENTIRDYATPVFSVAGLEPRAVKIYLVKNNALNAFVAGGQKLFIHTGLLIKSESANQLIGVIAHETGHIAGGHLSRTHSALAKSSTSAILGYILGGAATLATGRGDVGTAIAVGGQGVAARNFLTYSRTQESSADHAALKFLDATGQSAQGLMEFMQVLENQELLSAASQDPYVRTHPLSRDRIVTIQNHVKNSRFSNVADTPEQVISHARIKAKLYAFLNAPGRTLRVYKKSDNSLTSRYARTVAHYRQGKVEPALDILGGLLAEHPNDPYFHELKGQILFENARVRDSLESYQKASDLLPDSFLIRRDLARAQLELNDPQLIDTAIGNLKVALGPEPKAAFTWRLLATAYGRKGDEGNSSLALAEEALIKGKPDIASFHAGKAERLFPKGSREWIQSQDILLEIKARDKARKKKK